MHKVGQAGEAGLLSYSSRKKQNTENINKRLPVRYFTLARALSSASKYHTVIAYLGKQMEKELLNYEEKKQ